MEDETQTFLSDGPTASGSTISGSQTGNLRINDLTLEDEGEYLFWVEDDSGTMVPVNTTTLFIDRDAPEVLHQPVSREVCTNDTVTFRIDALNANGYEWAWNARPLEDGVLPTDDGPDVLVAGADTNELTLIGVTAEAAGEIACTILGPGGENGRNAEIFPFDLTVSQNTIAPDIVEQPAGLTEAQVGEDVQLSISALATDAESTQTYQWRKDGVPIFGDGRVFGTNFPDLLIENVEPSDAGVYDCVVTQACGTATSLPAVLTVSCPADANGDGQITPADFSAWILGYNSQSGTCDQNGDGLCTPSDFSAFILNYNAGC
ncbi:MAG: immunoglobulin domain-containing protein [Planctomycetota bacterium]